MTQVEVERLYSVREAAAQIGRSENAIRKLIKRKLIAVTRARDASIRIKGAEIVGFLVGSPMPMDQQKVS